MWQSFTSLSNVWTRQSEVSGSYLGTRHLPGRNGREDSPTFETSPIFRSMTSVGPDET